MNQLKLKQMLTDFFNEDIGDHDLSAELLFSNDPSGEFTLFSKDEGIFCGESIIQNGFKLLDEQAHITLFKKDGDSLHYGDQIATISGSIKALLSGERVVLNLIQRMSAIATKTAIAVAQTEGTTTKICDTRKTTPGLRMLEKYAVTVGGGFNHRNGLYDCVMLKDNHITFAGGITEAIQIVQKKLGHTVKIEVEVETKEDLLEAIEAEASIIMLDNCSPEQLREWLPLIPKHIVSEVSGGITIDTIQAYAKSGVDCISLGALTHSINAFDISALVKIKESFIK
ncbi:MAG TPA: carboxylating nicotinate-nucleotide diphosphorylase [Kurthia sp.]